jgi:hypothetical protein
MNRRWIVISLAVLAAAGLAAAFTMGSLASIDSSTPRAAEKELDLKLIVLVNRLQLTPEQLTAVRDRIAEVVDKARAIEARRDAFAKELLTFTGNEQELDAKLAAFEKEMNRLRKDLATTAQENVDELKGILTVRQGEVLREALQGRFRPAGAAGLTALRQGGRMAGRSAGQREATGQGSLQAPSGEAQGRCPRYGAMRGGSQAQPQGERWGFDTLESQPQSDGQMQGLAQKLGQALPLLRQFAQNHPQMAERLSFLDPQRQDESQVEARPLLKRILSRGMLEKLEQLLEILDERAGGAKAA